MSFIISFNGPDKSGKTTQLERLIKTNNQYHIVREVASFEPFPNLTGMELFKWWFYESSAEQFCEKFLMALSKLVNYLESNFENDEILLMDKGLLTYKARVKATLLVKGLTSEQSDQLIMNYMPTIEDDSREKIKLFFSTSKVLEERTIISLDRIKSNFWGDEKDFEIYKQYQIYQNNILEIYLQKNIFQVIDSSKEPDFVETLVHKELFKLLKLKY